MKTSAYKNKKSFLGVKTEIMPPLWEDIWTDLFIYILFIMILIQYIARCIVG